MRRLLLALLLALGLSPALGAGLDDTTGGLKFGSGLEWGSGVGTPSGLDINGAAAFSTLDPATLGAGVTLSNGNDTVTGNVPGGDSGALSTTAKSTGKFYFEITVGAGSGGDTSIGLANSSATFPGAVTTPSNADMLYRSGNTFVSGGTSVGSHSSAWVATNIIGVAADIGGGTLGFRNISAGDNWNLNVANNPATGAVNLASPNLGTPLFVLVGISSGSTDGITINFGATTFVGSVPAGYSAWH